MTPSKADIIARLQKDIFPLQGFKTNLSNNALDLVIGSIKNAFPGNSFPLGAMHEFIHTGAEEAAVTSGFITVLLASLMQGGRVAIWIGSHRSIFPPALKSFGIAPDKIIFIELQKEKEMLWAMEEALKCEGLAGVIGEIKELSFTASRRLQLAVEQSKSTGFIIRHNPRKLETTACVARWKINSLPSELVNNMPGVGFPRWNVELLKVRNGKPGKWQIEFMGGRFRHIYKMAALPPLLQKKTG
ncbi:MAG: Error-prone repair protein ImuA [Ferruginibacter sp.]